MTGRKTFSELSSQKGIEIKEAHFPGRAPIDAYGDGGFRFADMSHKGSLMCLPSGIYGWNVSAIKDFNENAFKQIIDESEEIEILLLGTGSDLMPINPSLREIFKAASIQADSMSTGAAVRTFNVLLAEERAVAVALLAV